MAPAKNSTRREQPMLALENATGGHDVTVELTKSPIQVSPLPPDGNYQNLSPSPTGLFKAVSPGPDADYSHVTPPPSGNSGAKAFTPPPSSVGATNQSGGDRGVRFAATPTSRMGVGQVRTPEVIRSPVTTVSPTRFDPDEMPTSPGLRGLISPVSPNLGPGHFDGQY